MDKDKRPITQLTLSGEFVAEFPFIKKAAVQFGGKNSQKANIANAANCNTRNKTALGFKWRFKEI